MCKSLRVLSSVSSAMEDVNKPDVKNEEERGGGTTMLTNRCLTHTYVIYKVSYAWLQLRQLA